MNIPPPGTKLLKIQVEPGETVVRYEHGGHKYELHITVSVVAVWPTGRKDAAGNDEFTMNMSPTIQVRRDGASI